MVSRQQQQNLIHQLYVEEHRSLYDIARKLAVPFRDVRQIAQDARWVWRPLQQFARAHRGVEVVLFDLETSGLPLTRGFNKFFPYTDDRAYDTSRIVQLAYCRYRIGEPICRDQVTSVFRRPDDFELSEDAVKIHQFSTEWLRENGRPLREIIPTFLRDIEDVQYILAHNTGFDVNIFENELHRLGYTPTQIETQWFPSEKIKCTCKMSDFTRLSTLYSWLPENNDSMNFHNAQDDVYALAQILNFLAS